VGKFAQRAGVGKREQTNEESLKEVCHEHALFSDSFVHDYVPERWRGQVSAPRRHHRPQSDQDYQVQLADWLSAGEREEDEDRHVPFLLSPFARLKGHTADAYFPLARLDPGCEATLFPGAVESRDWREGYNELWEDFTRACQALRGDNLRAYLESLYGLMQEFTWCVPAAYYGCTPDISLYDHARTTAALATCLAADGRDGAWCREVSDALRSRRSDGAAAREVCLLVGGDINGVQAFIYTLASEGAAKSLRARSFYLQLLTDAVAGYLLDELGLPTTNLLYAGGGGFQILAPVGSAARLEAARAEIARRLLLIHSGALGLTLEWTPVGAAEFGEFATARGRLSQRLNAAKRRPFATVDAGELAQHLGCALEFDQGGDLTSACAVCGAPEPHKGSGKCALCESLEGLGSDLPRVTHLLTFAVQPSEPRRVRSWGDGLRTFGWDVRVLNVGDGQWQARAEPPDGATLARLWRLEPADAGIPPALLERLARLPTVLAYRPFAQLTPYRWNKSAGRVEVATFDHLAEEAARGIKRWGVLRADVDNLGPLFQEVHTLSRIAALSRALQVFFEGYLPTVGRKWNRFSAALEEDGASPARVWGTEKAPGPRDKLYVQYAGGDDIFVVGAWDALPEFAARLREKLTEYACGNPEVTLSAGIALADAKFPLYQAAQWAGEAEEDAKHFRRDDGREKDAVTFLGQTMGWEHFGPVQARAERLAQWCATHAAPRALIQRLLAIDAEWRRGWKAQQKGARRAAPKFYFGPWMWQLVYYLKRDTEKRSAEVKDGVREIEEDLLKGKQVDRIGLAARWAELLIREG
jgi:CRISPR-associated protein Csm1